MFPIVTDGELAASPQIVDASSWEILEALREREDFSDSDSVFEPSPVMLRREILEQLHHNDLLKMNH